jgi:putative ABC transport system permease protein
MFTYNLHLAVNSILKTRYMSLLMVIAIGLGIGLSMTILTVYKMMAADPIPQKSAALHVVRLDAWNPLEAFREPNVAPFQLTYQDAMALRKSDIPSIQAAMFRTGFVAQPEKDYLLPITLGARATDRGFFTLFNVPFLFGDIWGATIDQNPAQVIVLSKATNDKLFGGENSIGRTLQLDEYLFKVVGVLDEWAPPMKYYDISNGPYNEAEEAYIPFSLTPSLELPAWGNTNGWKGETIESYADRMASEYIWIQYWAQLDSPDQVAEYQAFIDSYAMEQKKLGRFQRPLNNQLTPLMAWLEEREVVGSETRVLLALAFMFLAVCLLNVVGLILAKFSGKSAEISIRRALGADKATLFIQHLIESAVIGSLGGLLGLGMAMLGLVGIASLAPDISTMTTADYSLVIYTLLLSITCTLLAGLYPTWRVCQIQPASYLKTQ